MKACASYTGLKADGLCLYATLLLSRALRNIGNHPSFFNSPSPALPKLVLGVEEEVRGGYCAQIICWLKFLVAAKREEGKKIRKISISGPLLFSLIIRGAVTPVLIL